MNGLVVPANLQQQPQQAPAPHGQPGQAQQPMRGAIDIAIARPGQADAQLIDEQVVMSDLRNMGYQPRQLSPDGLSIMLDDGKGGLVEAHIPDVIQKMGYEVRGITPQNVNYDRVDTGLRAAISAPFMDDDDAKRAFLDVKLRKMGMGGAKLTGAGDDWHAFDPTTNQWIALTNKPGMDMSDLGQVAAEGPRIVGSMVGGGLGAGAGAVTGPGAIATGAAGAAAGGQAGDLLSAGITGGLDEDYRHIVADRAQRDPGGMAMGQLKKAGVDAVFGGIGGGASKYLPALYKGGMASTMARKGGGIAEGIGGMAEKGGGYLANASKAAAEGGETLGQGIAAQTAANSIFGLPSLAGDALQIPSQALHGAVKGIGSLGESGFMNEALPGVARWMRNAYAKYGAGATRGGDVIKNFAREQAAGRAGRGVEETIRGSEDLSGPLRQHVTQAYEDAMAGARKEGMDEASARQAAETFQDSAHKRGVDAIRERLENAARAGAEEAPNSWANGLNSMEDAGKTINKGVYGTTGALGSAVETGGRVLQNGGKGFRYLGEGLGKYETPTEIRLGAEEAYKRMRNKRRALQEQAAGSRINPRDPTLASTY